jgi:hypothetical protein
MEDDYELVASKRISKLKDDLERLRSKNPDTASMQQLQESIERLSTNLENILSVFEEAAEEMKLDDKETEVIAQKIDPLMDKLDAIIDQNKKIAQGVVAVADMISELKSKQGMPQQQKPRFVEKPMPPRQQEFRPQMAPQPMMRPAPDFNIGDTTTMGIPPPPGMMPPQSSEFTPDARPLPNFPPMPQESQLPPLPEPMGPPLGLPPQEKKKSFLGIRITK